MANKQYDTDNTKPSKNGIITIISAGGLALLGGFSLLSINFHFNIFTAATPSPTVINTVNNIESTEAIQENYQDYDSVSANASNVSVLSFHNFLGNWEGITNMYLAQRMEIAVNILNANDKEQTITLCYRYDMSPSGIWNGGSSDWSEPVTVSYKKENIKVQTGKSSVGSEFKETTGFVTDMISIIGSNKDVDSIISDKSIELCKFKLAIADDKSLYNMSSPSGWTYYDSYKCIKAK